MLLSSVRAARAVAQMLLLGNNDLRTRKVTRITCLRIDRLTGTGDKSASRVWARRTSHVDGVKQQRPPRQSRNGRCQSQRARGPSTLRDHLSETVAPAPSRASFAFSAASLATCSRIAFGA